MTALRRDWLTMRQRLHDRFEAVCGLPDASRLGTMRGPTTVLSESALSDLWQEAPASARNHLYLHVPFCKSICSFCNYERLRPSSPSQLEAWRDRVMQSIAMVAPSVRHLTFHSLYLGGGTPSVLPASMLDAVLTRLTADFSWHPLAGRHMELDPQVISPARIAVLRRHDFNHFSFGIQTLDVVVNRAHNRGEQDRAAVTRCLEMLRGAGSVHCDFLLGLAGTTPMGILAEVAAVLEDGTADTIDLYEIIPTRAYLASHFGGDRAQFEAHLTPFRQKMHAALHELAARHGRIVHGLGRHSFKLVRPRTGTGVVGRFGYTQLVHIEGHPINLLGLGPSARSRIFGVAAVRAEDPGADGDGFVYRGDVGGLTGELQVYLAHVLRDEDAVSWQTLTALFGDGAAAVLRQPLAAWQALGLATQTPEGVVMVPMDGPARVRALLWLLDTAHLEAAVAQSLGLPLTHWVARARLPPGPWRVASAEGVRLQLARGEDAVVLRLAPSLTGAGARWVVETGGAFAGDAALRRAVSALRRGLPG